MSREVQARFHVIERQGRRPLYRAVISGPDVRGLKTGDYFRFKARTAAGVLSAEFVSKLLERAGEEAVMVTVPPVVVEASGLGDASTVALQLVGPASAREAAESAGKGREFSDAHERRLRRRRAERTPTQGVVRTETTSAEKLEARKLEAVPEAHVQREPQEPVSLIPPESRPPEVPRELGDIAQPVPSPSKPETMPIPPPVATAAAHKEIMQEKKPKRRRELPEDAVSRVRNTVVAMEKKVIYLHLVPDIVLGRLRTKRQIDEAVDAIFRDVAAAS